MGEPAPKPNPFQNFFLKDAPWYKQVAAAWPLLLIVVGGALGGACGGGAYYFNRKIMMSKLPDPLKYLYSLLVGLAGVLTFFLIVAVLTVSFPGVFGSKVK